MYLYPGMKHSRSFRIVSPETDKTVTYTGKKLNIELK